jgi:hypothetical protein
MQWCKNLSSYVVSYMTTNIFIECEMEITGAEAVITLF